MIGRISRFMTRFVSRWLPDPLIFAMLLTLLTFVIALWLMMRRAINKGEKRDKCLCCCVTNREKELQKQSEVTRRDEPNYRISFVLAQI